jgi:hypothetical protein
MSDPFPVPLTERANASSGSGLSPCQGTPLSYKNAHFCQSSRQAKFDISFQPVKISISSFLNLKSLG